MKTKWNLIIILAFLGSTLMAQDASTDHRNSSEIKTLFGSDISHGGYGGVTMGFTQINDKDAWMVGGRAAWIIDHSFALGFAGYGIANDIPVYNDWNNDEQLSLIVGYGGLLLEPIFFAREPVHFTVPVLIAGGAVSMAPEDYWNTTHHWDPSYKNDVIFVFEPGIEIELNLTRFMRLSGGASYRLTSEVDLPGMDSDILEGWATTLSLKFGKF